MSRLNSENDTLGPRPRFKSFAGLKDIDRYQDQFQKGDRDSVLPDKKGLAVRKRYLKRLMNPSSLSHSKEVQVMASKTKPPQKVVENKALTGYNGGLDDSSSWDTSASDEEEKNQGGNRQPSNSKFSKKYANLQKRKRKSSSDSSSSNNLEMDLTNSLKLKRLSSSNAFSISDENNDAADDIPNLDDLDNFTDSSVPLYRPSCDEELKKKKRNNDSRISNHVEKSPKRHKKIFSKASCDHSAFEREIQCLQNENEELKKEIAKNSGCTTDLRKIKNNFIAKILVHDQEETDEENLWKLGIGPLFRKFESTYALSRASHNPVSPDVSRLLSRIEKLEKDRDRNDDSISTKTFEKIMSNINESNKEKEKYQEEAKSCQEKLNDTKEKLFLQRQIRDNYEKQQNDIMELLNIPDDCRSFSKLREAVIDLKNSYIESKERAESLEVKLGEAIVSDP